MTGGRLALRLARREVWRRPGRTALVALLVALPVAGMVAAVVLIRTDRAETDMDRWRAQYGAADAVAWNGAAETRADGGISIVPVDGDGTELISLPAGSRALVVANRWQRVRSDDGRRANAIFNDAALLDPMTSPVYRHLDGRAPAAAGEVAITGAVARRFGVAVGDRLVLDRPTVSLEVTGLVERRRCLSCMELVAAPGQLASAVGSDLTAGSVDQRILVELPDRAALTADEVAAIVAAGQQGLTVSPEWAASAPEIPYQYGSNDDVPIRWSFVLGALVLTVAGIVISAAFAVGARRQLVTLGQLSASGAPPATVRLALVLQGTVTGLVGAAVGLLVAGVGLLLGRGLVERVLDRRIDGYTVRAADVLLVVVLGTVAATVAALIPARSAAGIPTLTALAGRRPLQPVPRRLVGWGAAAFGGGLALLGLAVVGARGGDDGEMWAYVAILGGVAELLGACALAPVLVARLEPLAARLRGSWRLGARSLARHRSRTGAVVSAVSAAGALAIAAAALLIGSERRDGHEDSMPDDVVVAQAVTYDVDDGGAVDRRPMSGPRRADLLAALAGATELEVAGIVIPPPTGQEVLDVPMPGQWMAVELGTGRFLTGAESPAVPDDALLDLLDAPDRARQALAAGEVVVFTDEPGGPVELTLPDGRRLPAVRSPRGDHSLGWFDQVLVPRALAAELGFEARPVASVFQTDGPLTEAQRDDLEDIFYDSAGPDGVQVLGSWHTPTGGPTAFQIELILTGVALVFSLFVVGVSLALAAAESRDERDVLTVAGAPPGALARSAGARAWLLSAIGGLMAIPVGFLPVVVFARASSTDSWSVDFPIVFPTRTALVLLVLVPGVVALAAWAASATAQRFRPVRVSTATFE